MHIGEDPVARQGLAFKLHSEAVAHRAVGAIATDQPGGLDGFLMPVRTTQDRHHTVVLRSEPNQLDLPLNPHAEGGQVLLQQPFGLALRQHQRIGMRRLDRIQPDMSDLAAARDNVSAGHFDPGPDEGGAAAHAVDQLQRAAPQHEVLRFVCVSARLVDDANRHAVASQFRGHRQSDRAGTDNENTLDHR